VCVLDGKDLSQDLRRNLVRHAANATSLSGRLASNAAGGAARSGIECCHGRWAHQTLPEKGADPHLSRQDVTR
jgi:hypothetical protein